MATLESRLEEAAREGSVEKLIELLEQDPLLLDTVVADDPPLHIASLLGHVEFADWILRRKPHLARALDSKGSCPLHLAAAKGHVEIVRLLVQVDSEYHTCLFRDADGWNPLQLAAVNGHVDALKELVGACPEAARARTAVDRGGNALHLCVKNNQLEALKVLVPAACDIGFVNDKDDFGCSILHLAVSYKQIETVGFLFNTNGMEADVNNSETANLRGGQGGQQQRARLMRQREALMVVASVVATMAFQAAINPPGGVWQDAGKSTTHPVRLACFVSSISFSFVFSIIELFLLIADYPSTCPHFLRFLWIAKILSIGGMTVAFVVAILCLT